MAERIRLTWPDKVWDNHEITRLCLAVMSVNSELVTLPLDGVAVRFAPETLQLCHLDYTRDRGGFKVDAVLQSGIAAPPALFAIDVQPYDKQEYWFLEGCEAKRMKAPKPEPAGS